MADIKINEKARFDIKDGYLIIKSQTKLAKLNARSYAYMCGVSDFNSVGATLLDRLGLLDFEGIDPFYTLRGAIAERLVFWKVSHDYGGKVEIKTTPIKSFDEKTKQFKFNKNSFNSNSKFSGYIDIEITSPKERQAIIEVKSKSLGKMENVLKYLPQDEIKQGEFYCALRNYTKLVMMYVFFDETQEAQIRDYLPKISDFDRLNDDEFVDEILSDLQLNWQSVKIKPIVRQVDVEWIMADMNTKYGWLEKIDELKRIKLSSFNSKDREIIEQHIINTSIDGGNLYDDLPF